MKFSIEDIDRILQSNEISNFNDIISKRKINNLVHFTRLENLSSILKNGFRSRKYLQENNLSFQYNDTERWDNKTNAICFSIEYPNIFLLNKFKQIYLGSKWLIIILDVNILLDSKLVKSFCMRNAGGLSKWLEHSICHYSSAFEKMFCENPCSKVPKRSEQNYIKDYLPTDIQAEIFVLQIMLMRYYINIILLLMKNILS